MRDERAGDEAKASDASDDSGIAGGLARPPGDGTGEDGGGREEERGEEGELHGGRGRVMGGVC